VNGATIASTLSDRAAVSSEGSKIAAPGSGLNTTAARLRPGTISESSSSHLPPSVASALAKPVMFPPGWLSVTTRPLATGSPRFANTIGIVRVSRWTATAPGVVPFVTMMSGCRPTPHVAALGPTQMLKRLLERKDTRPLDGIAFVERHEHPDTPYPPRLLRPRHHRPRRSTPEPYDELPPLHWITSSAVANSVSGIVRPSALAVLRLMTNLYLSAPWTEGRWKYHPAIISMA
jgi:hypothetical protein